MSALLFSLIAFFAAPNRLFPAKSGQFGLMVAYYLMGKLRLPGFTKGIPSLQRGHSSGA